MIETIGCQLSPHQNEGYIVDACLIQIKASLTDFVLPVSHRQQKRVKVRLTLQPISLTMSARIYPYKHTVSEKRKTRIDPISNQKYLVTHSITPNSPKNVVHHTPQHPPRSSNEQINHTRPNSDSIVSACETSIPVKK